MSWSEKFLDEVGIRGEQIPRFSRFPSKTAPFDSLRPRVGSDYLSLEDILVFWRLPVPTKSIRDPMELNTGFAAVTVLPTAGITRLPGTQRCGAADTRKH